MFYELTGQWSRGQCQRLFASRPFSGIKTVYLELPGVTRRSSFFSLGLKDSTRRWSNYARQEEGKNSERDIMFTGCLGDGSWPFVRGGRFWDEKHRGAFETDIFIMRTAKCNGELAHLTGRLLSTCMRTHSHTGSHPLHTHTRSHLLHTHTRSPTLHTHTTCTCIETRGGQKAFFSV